MGRSGSGGVVIGEVRVKGVVIGEVRVKGVVIGAALKETLVNSES